MKNVVALVAESFMVVKAIAGFFCRKIITASKSALGHRSLSPSKSNIPVRAQSKPLSKLLSLPLLSAFLLGCQTPITVISEYCSPQRDLALVNGSIHTMNAQNDVVSSVLIKNGVFAALDGIGVGRFADLAVLSKNVFDSDEVSDADIRKMTSNLTILAGRIVHSDGSLTSSVSQ